MPDVLVVNASPLIFLGNAGQLDLLRVLGSAKVLVPQAVYDEVAGATQLDQAARAVTAAV